MSNRQRRSSKDLAVYDPDNDTEFFYLRPRDIAVYVAAGTLDVGITGREMLLETAPADGEGPAAVEVMPLGFGRSSFRFATPVESGIDTVDQLAGKRIATEAVGLTKQYLERHGVRATVGFSWGATEVKPPELADAIVEVTETGSSLRANNLRIVEEILQSTPRFIANEQSYADPWKRQKIDNLVLMLQSCLAAEDKVGLMMNVRRDNLGSVLGLLPALQTPTVSNLSDPDWVDVNTIVDESVVRNIVPQLKAAGARGIVEYGINKIID